MLTRSHALTRTTVVAVLFAAFGAVPRVAAATLCDVNGGIAGAVSLATTIVVARIDKVTPPEPKITRGPDGQETITVTSGEPYRIDLTIEDTFKGSVSGHVQIDSVVHLTAGTRYVIYGFGTPDRIVVAACSRMLAVSDADADLRYLAGMRKGIAQGVVYGPVSSRSPDGVGTFSLVNAVVVALSSDNVRQQVTTGKFGYFAIVLTPGAYLFWIERDGRQVGNPARLDVAVGDQAFGFIVN